MNLLFEYIQYWRKSNYKTNSSDETLVKIKNCISASNTKLAFETELKIFRLAAKQDDSVISVKDFGAGSKKMSSKRKIKDIYKNSRSTKKYQRLLYQLIREFDCKNVLEMGTSLGYTSVYLSKANDIGKIITVEACPNTAAKAKKLFTDLKLTNIELVNSTFSDYFDKDSQHQYDLVFVDGHHEGTALLDYMSFLTQNCTNNCLFVLDDIRWSDNMRDAWTKLINQPEFKIHHDLFRMGILVFQPQNEV